MVWIKALILYHLRHVMGPYLTSLKLLSESAEPGQNTSED